MSSHVHHQKTYVEDNVNHDGISKTNEDVAKSKCLKKVDPSTVLLEDVGQKLQLLLGLSNPLSTKKIMSELPLKRFTPKVYLYDGKSDLVDHLYHKKYAMPLFEHSDALLCKA